MSCRTSSVYAEENDGTYIKATFVLEERAQRMKEGSNVSSSEKTTLTAFHYKLKQHILNAAKLKTHMSLRSQRDEYSKIILLCVLEVQTQERNTSCGKASLNRMSSCMSAFIGSLILKAKSHKTKVILLHNSLEVYAVNGEKRKCKPPYCDLHNMVNPELSC